LPTVTLTIGHDEVRGERERESNVKMNLSARTHMRSEKTREAKRTEVK